MTQEKEETKTNEIKTEKDDMTGFVSEWQGKFKHMQIDYKALQMYFKKLKDLINNDN